MKKRAQPRKQKSAPSHNGINITEEEMYDIAGTKTKKSFEIKQRFALGEAHKTFLDLCLYDKTKMVFVDGVAGTAKSYCAVLAGLTLLKAKKKQNIVYIRSIVESASKSIGALPGEIDEKFKPWSLPLLEKLHEIITEREINDLVEDGAIKCLPVNFVRGLTFHNSVVIIDESQNLTKSEIITILTRFGQNSLYIVIGDSHQRDIGYQSGFADIFNKFDDTESVDHQIHTIKFSESEIVRSQILKFIVRKLEKRSSAPGSAAE